MANPGAAWVRDRLGVPYGQHADTSSDLSSRVRLSSSQEPSGRYLHNRAAGLLG
jgi:hypothetical protein